MDEVRVRDLNWFLSPEDVASVQVRYNGSPVPCSVEEGEDGEWVARLDEPVMGVAAGQSAVFYDAGGEEVGEGYSSRVYAFISYFEMAARFETGLADSALAQIRATYGHMAAQDPGVTMWEGIGAGGSKV